MRDRAPGNDSVFSYAKKPEVPNTPGFESTKKSGHRRAATAADVFNTGDQRLAGIPEDARQRYARCS